MNSLDILIDLPLLQEQYEFLINRYQAEMDAAQTDETIMNVWDEDRWEGILGFFEAILEDTGTLDNTRLLMLDSL